MIIGKNNSTKTTVITALNKILNSTVFIANDFNFIYLNAVLEKYKANDFKEKTFCILKLLLV